jgi:hypothetical protein
VPAHRQALRDFTYADYLVLNEEIHGVGEECAICGRGLSGNRRFDRDHDHTTGYVWSGKPRGLACVSCNILMPPKMTAHTARLIANYLERVESYYGCVCGEINSRNCPVHQDAA